MAVPSTEITVAATTTTIVPRAQPVPATTVVTPHVLQTLLCLPPLSGVLFFNHVHVQPSLPPSPSAFISQAPIWLACGQILPEHFSQHQDMAVRLQCLHPSSAGVVVGWVAENQENSQKNHRKLAESTRDFKKAQPEEKLNLFSSLLKSYQEEVDNLTKRAKFGENAFLNIYQKLYEAPDPYPALASIGVSAKGFCMSVAFEQHQ
ncbi:protein CASP [Cucumis melo var. makuwa]|uniref:Protein CASP n=1 Tax=Cucumis melo var. makuwa TaxID=1194695 RepID=A0A5A7VFQ5_CUCMM|nr:protein CASP [Cucumis melo var. makuwa]